MKAEERAANLTWMAAVITLAITSLALGSCRSFVSAQEVRQNNRARLGVLKLGMTADEVDQIMGKEEFEVALDRWWGLPSTVVRIENPYRVETGYSKSGEQIEVRYYYTGFESADAVITDGELTPIILKNGRLIGIGWADLLKVRGW